MRRDVYRAASLRTGSISRDTVSDDLRNRFLADAQNDNERVHGMTEYCARKGRLKLLFLQLAQAGPVIPNIFQ